MSKGKPNKQPAAPKQVPTNGQGISKLDAVRQAISSLGDDAKPLQIRNFVKSKFGFELNKQLTSNYKAIVIKQVAGQSSVIRKPEPIVTAKALATVAGGNISLEDIRAVKAVIDQVGAEKVRQLADVLAK